MRRCFLQPVATPMFAQLERHLLMKVEDVGREEAEIVCEREEDRRQER